ncbi:NAD(+) diphosphatase [Aurantiacibacter spongiae]|uniref:NAD(+) diphosphatase n=1 Tax=Aurantiacibacter spongiae TaxID=2488860 RepID=A0A3N5CTS3_9SPHN|nr:NAD(+) diphosphatase [Aurantiacibacter spongiae]RPF70800.1 NAD(+) diphosphatase [Aurantiacibacter spongiae]
MDRDDHARASPEALARYAARSDARVLAMDGLAPLLGADGRLRRDPMGGEGGDLAFLGLENGAPLFVALPDLAEQDRWAGRQAMGHLSPAELALFGGARALVDWHARHGFCANCGGATRLAKGGWERDCERCGAMHFPRTDPVAIMLVEQDGALLLGRQERFPPRSYSALAGFVEPGESLEEAVAREVMEEAGIAVRDVSYVASQPWPFPSQLMLGCHALADSRELTIDTTELEDARWFTRAEVAEAVERGQDATGFVPPPRIAIAHSLLRRWLETHS